MVMWKKKSQYKSSGLEWSQFLTEEYVCVDKGSKETGEDFNSDGGLNFLLYIYQDLNFYNVYVF